MENKLKTPNWQGGFQWIKAFPAKPDYLENQSWEITWLKEGNDSHKHTTQPPTPVRAHRDKCNEYNNYIKSQ